jgi:hypothetical protein
MKPLLIAFLVCAIPRLVAAEPVVYLAQNPNFCAALSGDTYYLYVHSLDDPDFTGASLNLEIGGTVSGPPVITTEPASGVTLVSVDTSTLPYHVELLWTTRSLEHERVATVVFPSPPTWDTGARTTDVVLTRPGGEVVSARDIQAVPYSPDCHICWLCFNVDEHIVVPSGETTIPFEWSFWCYSSGGLGVVVTDTENWVTSWNPTAGTGTGYCAPCYADYFPGTIQISVPPDTPPGTTSSLTLIGDHNGYYCPAYATIEYAGVVSTEVTTWGRIKALYH